MIAQLVQLLQFTFDVLYKGYYYSFKIGQFLVNLGTIFYSNLLVVIQVLCFTLQIVTESFAVFIRDISALLQEFSALHEAVASVFTNIFSSIQSGVLGVYHILSDTATFFYNIVQWLFTTTITFVALCKHLVVLFGLGAWWAITLIPLLVFHTVVQLIDSTKEVFKLVTDSVSSSGRYMRQIVKEVYHFVTDVPIESTLGIVIATCLLYVFIEFYKELYLFFYRKIFYIIIRVRRLWRNLNFTMPSILTWPSQPEIPVPDERVCIICQERPKCVLLLPCRHICLCLECSRRVQLNTNTCPICRDYIDNTMKVFV